MIELDPATLRTLADELSEVADDAGARLDNDQEQYLAGFCANLADTYRTRALQTEINWKAPTRELPIVLRGAS